MSDVKLVLAKAGMSDVMNLGAHVSIAGGLFNAPLNAAKLDCETFQMFSRSPHGGAKAEITPALIEQFQTNLKKAKISRFYFHAPYFINLGSTNNRIFYGTVSAIRDELERGTLLGCTGVMFHPGSGKEVGRKKGLDMVVDGINKILEGYTGTTQLLIENSAGAGEILCDSFEEIAYVLKKVKSKNVGVCLDTCHVFASGYDVRTKKDIDAMLTAFDKQIGLDKLVCMHINDSKTELNAHRDRHEIIGKGTIGLEPFRILVNHPKLKKVDGLLETPDLKAKGCDSLETMFSLRSSNK